MADRKDRRAAGGEPTGPTVPEDNDAPETPGTGTPPMTGRQKLRLVGLVILKRVRFIAILAAVGLFIGYWDTIKNYWDKWTRPKAAAVRELEAGQEFFCPMHPQVVQTTFAPNGDVPNCPICGMPLSVRKKGEAGYAKRAARVLAPLPILLLFAVAGPQLVCQVCGVGGDVVFHWGRNVRVPHQLLQHGRHNPH